MNEMLEYCSRTTGYEEQVVEKVVDTFLSKIVDELSHGNSVDLGREFGKFSTKLRTSHLQENSPRTPKDSRYKVVFRENSGMKKRLKIMENNGEEEK